MEFARFIVQYFAAPAALVAAVAWLAREIIKHFLATQGEKARMAIEHQSSLAIERVRQDAASQLESARHQFNLQLERQRARFSRLQDERVSPLLELYRAMATLSEYAVNVHVIASIDTDSDIDSYLSELNERYEAANKAFFQSLLFLPEPTADQVERLLSTVRDAEQNHYIELKYASKDRALARSHLVKALDRDFTGQTRAFAREIRQLLGVEENEPLPATPAPS